MATLTQPTSDGKLRYYILRKPGHEMIPPTPVDQLPFQLQRVPRQLSHRQLSDEGWKLLDETSEPAMILPAVASSQATPFQTSSPPPPKALSKFRAPNHHVREAPQILEEAQNVKSRTVATPARKSWTSTTEVTSNALRAAVPSAASPSPRPQSLTDSFAEIYPKDAQRVGYRIPYPSGVEPDPSKKEYCTYWIRHGECDYMAQGCKYKHEMPPIDVLRKLGFRETPKWIKERKALDSGGKTWMQLRREQEKEEEDASNNEILDDESQSADPSKMRNAKLEAIFSARVAATNRNNAVERAVPGKEAQRMRVERPGSKKVASAPVMHDLIDLDAPNRPSSPQSSHCSAASIASSAGGEFAPSVASTVTSTHSVSSPSSPVQPTASAAAPAPVYQARLSKANNKKPQPSARRLSQISWSSDDEALKISKQQFSRRKAYPKRPNNAANTNNKQSTTPLKKSGLAQSKHVVPQKGREKQSTYANASQRNARMKMKNVGSGDGSDLQTQIAEHTCAARQMRGSRDAAHATAAVVSEPSLL
ncbi:hypothetical protein CC80DRAFT_535069 [Byssothecium circinans]|uniref:C3H1-type domain-containing protein n=1 Tax=Byssothecium circinans TaxID=147558 RepID=A0A6A5TXI2_9PLEO|nr:hypothetical protein CC80DRAFT_535069 [Byssothecium circinans]